MAELVRPEGTVARRQLRLDWVHPLVSQTQLRSSLGYVPPSKYESQIDRTTDTLREPLPSEVGPHRTGGGFYHSRSLTSSRDAPNSPI